MTKDRIKLKLQSHIQDQHHLHVQLPRKIVEVMLEKRHVSGMTMRDQIIRALKLEVGI